jgi:hypothetical protein
MSYEITYCGDCHCNHSCGIESNLCLKRFFDISLPTQVETLRLVFCAEYLRSCIQTEMIKTDTSYIGKQNIKYLLEKIITPYLPKIVAGGYNPKKSRINNIYFTVNKKLGIFCTYTFEECLEFIINNQESRFTDILNSVIREIDNYCLTKKAYLKYKSTVANLIRLSKQLKKTCISNEQIAIICCEIMTIILMSESEVKKQNKIILNN